MPLLLPLTSYANNMKRKGPINPPPLLAKILAKMDADPWHIRFRRWFSVWWQLTRIDLCGGSYFIHHDQAGNELPPRFKRPWLAKLLFW